MITAQIISGTDSAVKIRVYHDGEPLDFSAVTRMTAQLENSAVEIDTDEDADLITWNSSGEITLKFGGLGVAAGDRRISITAFDAAHELGQLIIDIGMHNLVLRFD